MALQNPVMEALEVLIVAKVLSEGGAFRLLRDAHEDATMIETTPVEAALARLGNDNPDNAAYVTNPVDLGPPPPHQPRKGVLRSKSAAKVSRSLSSHAKGEYQVVRSRTQLAKSAAKCGVTTDKYIAWMISHKRGEAFGIEKFKVFSLAKSTRLLDKAGVTAPKAMAKKMGVCYSAILRARQTTYPANA